MKKFWIVLLPLPLLTQHNRTTCLIDAPTAYILSKGISRVSISGSVPDWPFSAREPKVLEPRHSKADLDFSISHGLLKNLEISVSVYTPKNYALGLSYQALKEREKRPAVALGIHEINWLRHISSVGGGYDANGNPIGWDYDVEYYPQTNLLPSENFSIFGVISKEFMMKEKVYTRSVVTPQATYYYKYASVLPLFRIHLGLGRGRYVGYGPHSHLFNTDIFFGSYKESPKHEWALGLFGGVEFAPGNYLSPVLEYDGRDFNIGFSSTFPYGEDFLVHFYLSIDKLEGYFWGQGEYFHRFALGMAIGFPLITTSTLKGIVYDVRTREPIGGAIIGFPNTNIPSATCDPITGCYHIESVPSGKLIARVEKPGYITTKFELSIKPRKTIVADFPLRRRR